MNIEDVPIFGNAVDKSQVPPIHQKRILAFVNNFIMTTCSFLNDFATNCETKFIGLERKMQKVEASLIIIESKLSSIEGLETKNKVEDVKEVQVENLPAKEPELTSEAHDEPLKEAETDVRYQKYLKMLQVGVPAAAVKLKIESDGLDPNFLEYTLRY